ncbi:hypothetical protein [Haloprofundus salilacus]|uniref:hypothetical protein n=1 Tax=Haloprofundus salilacus TaxID=2876190 RepID=UPI001CCE32AB|nr:hypothetical protein [Haloprofundus salilacus]
MTCDGDGGNVNGGSLAQIRSIAVTADVVVAAVEARRRDRAPAVLRVTPPFAGRMRARLHLAGSEGTYDGPTEPIHLDPERLVTRVPPFPTPDEAEDRLREAGRYSVDTHRDEHVNAVGAWRETVRDAIVETVTIETDEGEHEVAVKRLG